MSDNIGPKNGATIEELTMIRDNILLPHMLTVCQNSLEQVERSSNAFNPYFKEFIVAVMARINKELFAIRREFSKRKIKTRDDGAQNDIIYVQYWCRGYEGSFGVARETLRTELQLRMAKYAREVWSPGN